MNLQEVKHCFILNSPVFDLWVGEDSFGSALSVSICDAGIGNIFVLFGLNEG